MVKKNGRFCAYSGSKKTTSGEISEAVESICSSGIDFHIRNIAEITYRIRAKLN